MTDVAELASKLSKLLEFFSLKKMTGGGSIKKLNHQRLLSSSFFQTEFFLLLMISSDFGMRGTNYGTRHSKKHS